MFFSRLLPNCSASCRTQLSSLLPYPRRQLSRVKHTSFDLSSDFLFCSFHQSIYLPKHCCFNYHSSLICVICCLARSGCLFFLLEFSYFLVTVGMSSSWCAETMAHLLGLCTAAFRMPAPWCAYSEGSNWARSRVPGAQVLEEEDAGWLGLGGSAPLQC